MCGSGLAAAVRPVFPAAEAEPECRPLFVRDAGPSAGPPAEVKQLGARVAELETALQTETRRAREAGRAEGEAAGCEMARAELAPVIDRLTRGIGELANLRARIRRDSESDLVKLSLCIARRILRRELTVDRDAVHGLVKAALDKVQAKDLRRIRVHPEFAGTIRRHIETDGRAAGAEIVPDTSLQPGDVVLETRLGDLDASIESQLAEIERGFADRLRG